MTARGSKVADSPDFLVVGGGIVGITLALELTRRFPGAAVTLLEKEPGCGRHASGRNSGVLHAGFYYAADSLKARLTREGNRRMTTYCDARGLRVNRCGKLVVARGESDLPALEELFRRGRAAGVDVREVTELEARDLEPLARTFQKALWSPTTASVDPGAVMRALVHDAESAGVRLQPATAYLGRRRDGTIATTAGLLSPRYLVNAAGLYADRVARDFGFSRRYRILPFKGLYLTGSRPLGLRRHVYPVPHLENPFLGVHFTITAHGGEMIGPTATPAFWREHYSGLSRFSLGEFAEVVWREARLFLGNDFGFRGLALAELKKYRRGWLLRLARELVPSASDAHFTTWGAAGIRAQLYDIGERKLEMDFRYEGDDRSFHVLNAVSPAFTCALPFAEHLVAEIAARVR